MSKKLLTILAFWNVWTLFVASKIRIPRADITVVQFKSRCTFRKCIPSKHVKCGINMWWCCDSFILGGIQMRSEIIISVHLMWKQWHTLVQKWSMGEDLYISVALAEEVLTRVMNRDAIWIPRTGNGT